MYLEETHMSMLLKDEAYDKLIRMINDGELVYGQTYSLNILASQMGMSRTPVREAVQKLCDELSFQQCC